MSYIVKEITLCDNVIDLGAQGSHDVIQYNIDITPWTNSLGTDGTVEVSAKRSQDETPYEVAGISYADGVVSWVVDDTDTGYTGTGTAEVRYTTADGGLIKSKLYATRTFKCHGDSTSTPSTFENWYAQMVALYEQFAELTAEAETLAEGSDATASFDSSTGVLTLGIPTGAQGEQGETGNGIASVAKTSTSGTVDTYTITFTDGTTTTFTVTNAGTLTATDDGAGNVTVSI